MNDVNFNGSRELSLYVIPVVIGVFIMIGSVMVYNQLIEYEQEILASNKEKMRESIENVITRREGRIHTISSSFVAFYSVSEFGSSHEFDSFSKILLGSNSEALNLFVMKNDTIIYSYPTKGFTGSEFDSLFPTYPTEINGTKAMTAVFPIDSTFSLIVAVPFDYFIQNDVVISDHYKLILFSPIDNNVTLYEIEKTLTESIHSVTFAEDELECTIRIEKQTGLFGYKLQDYYDLEYLIWDATLEQRSPLPLFLLVLSIVLSVIIPTLLIRTNILKNQLQKKSVDLQNVNQDLVNVRKSKDEFISMIAHDLKNPLVPIRSFIDILLTQKLGVLNDAQVERLNSIKTSLMTLQKMMADLLDANKLELGKLKLDIKRHNLTELVRRSAANLDNEIRKKGITLSVHLEDDVICECDETRINQVLTNLILNAVDFVPESTGKIDIVLSSDQNAAKITVTDNGIGIPKDKIDNLFARFYQIPTDHNRKYGGSGLGLSICKGIVDGHAGRIWVESNGHGSGSKFYVEIPLKQTP